MKKRYTSCLAAAVSSLSLAGCQVVGEKESCILLSSDFEQFVGWTSFRPKELNDEQAHSGHYSLRLPAGAEYGTKYLTLLDRCAQPPRHLQLSAWVYFPSGRIGSTSFVIEVNCHGRRPNVWQSFDVESLVRRFRKWEPVHWRVTLPADLEPTDELAVYMWHSEPLGDNIWFDDLRLSDD